MTNIQRAGRNYWHCDYTVSTFYSQTTKLSLVPMLQNKSLELQDVLHKYLYSSYLPAKHMQLDPVKELSLF